MNQRNRVPLVAVAILLIVSLASAGDSDAGKAEVLADLVGRLLDGTIHPSLGDDRKEVEKELTGQIVTDEIYYYSNLQVAYPLTVGSLQGLVEWEMDDGPLSMISFKVVDFHADRTVLLEGLERMLRDCEMEQDGENEWSCIALDHESIEILVEAYFAPGLVLLEIST